MSEAVIDVSELMALSCGQKMSKLIGLIQLSFPDSGFADNINPSKY